MISYCLGMFAALGWQYPAVLMPTAAPFTLGQRMKIVLQNVESVPLNVPSGVSYLPNYRVQIQTAQGKVLLSRPREFGYIRVPFKGRDGSFLCRYGTERNVIEYSVVHGKQTQKLVLPKADSQEITEYQDRYNYAGTYIEKLGGKDVPYSPHRLFEVRRGKFRDLGWGKYQFRINDGSIVSSVPVNQRGEPASFNDEVYNEVWITNIGGQLRIARGSIVGLSGRNSFYIQDKDAVYEFKNGGVTVGYQKPPSNPVSEARFANNHGDFFAASQTEDGETNIYLFRNGIYHLIEAKEAFGHWLPSSVVWKSRNEILIEKYVGTDKKLFRGVIQ